MESMWKYHNEALKHPEYQLEGVMDCFREEMSYYYPKEVSEYPERVTPEEPWIKRQWDIINQLRFDQINLRKTLYETLEEIKERANASKRKPTNTNKLNNIYRGIENDSERL